MSGEEDLSAEASELLELLLAREGRGAAGPPLSHTQERLWRSVRLEPGSVYFNVAVTARLRGPLEVPRLRAALEAVVARHAVLRTTCAERDGAPIQALHPPAPFELPIEDLGGRADAEDAARRALEAQSRVPLDLGSSPLLQARLVRLGPDDHVLGLFTHLFVADGWSTRVLGRELTRLYASSAPGAPAPPPLALQYADFARAQREADSAVLEADLEYWKRELHGLPRQLALPTDRPYPRVPSHAGAKLSFALEPPLAEALRRLARREGATLFMTLVAGLHALLAGLSGQDDVVVGTLVSNRSRAGSEDLIGTFSNLLAIRARLGDDPAFSELLRRVRDAAVRAYGHQAAPFDRLLEELPVAGGGRNALVQVLLVLHEQPFARSLELPGIVVSPFAIDPRGARYDLSFEVVETGAELDFAVTYNADVLEAKTCRTWLDAYVGLLRAAAGAPERRVSALTEGIPRPVRAAATLETLARPATSPADEGRLAALWREVLRVESVSADDDFFDLGGHSLLAVRLMERVEQEFGRKLPLSALLEAPTLAELGRLLGEEKGPVSGVLVPIRASGSAPPFYLVHGLGGEVLGFRALAGHVDPRRPFIGVQDPRLFGDAEGTQSVESLGIRYFAEVQRMQPRGPYFFGGFCMGSAIAYEMARAATRAGESVALLAQIDSPPLPLGYRSRTRDRVRVVWNAAVSRLRTGETGPIEPNEAPMNQVHRRMLRRYRPARYAGPVALIFVEQGPLRASEDALASYRAIVDGDVEVLWLSGSHRDLTEARSAPQLAAILNELLSRADPPRDPR